MHVWRSLRVLCLALVLPQDAGHLRGRFAVRGGDLISTPTELSRNMRRCGSQFNQCPGGALSSCQVSVKTSKVSFALVTGKAHMNRSSGRPWAQRDTWLSAVPEHSWVYFSDVEDNELPAYIVQGTEGGWRPSQRKWLGILERLSLGAPPFDSPDFFPQSSDWLFVADDDTFVFPDTLMERLGGIDPAARDWYLGLPDKGIAKALGYDLSPAESYCQGGAGFALSRRLAADLRGQDIQSTCGVFFENGAHADVAFARCLQATVGVGRCQALPGLNQVPFPFGQETGDSAAPALAGEDLFAEAEGDFPACPPISFHWMKPQQMRTLWSSAH